MAKHGFAQIVLLVLSQRCDWRARALFARPWAGFPNLAESPCKIIFGAQAASDTTRTANQAFLRPDEQITCRVGVISDENLSIKPIRRLAAGKLDIKVLDEGHWLVSLTHHDPLANFRPSSTPAAARLVPIDLAA